MQHPLAFIVAITLGCTACAEASQILRAVAPAEVVLDGAFPAPVTLTVRAEPLVFAVAGDVCSVPADAAVHIVETRDVGTAASAQVLRWPPERPCTPLAIVNIDEPNGLARCGCGGILLPARGRFGLVVGAAADQGAGDVRVTFLGDGIPAAALRADHPVPKTIADRVLSYHFIGAAAPSALAGARARIAAAPATLFLYVSRSLAFPELLPAQGRMQPDALLDQDEPVLLQTFSPSSCTVLGVDGQLFTVPTDALQTMPSAQRVFPAHSRRCDDLAALMLDAALRDGVPLLAREPTSDVGRAYRAYMNAADALKAFSKPVPLDVTEEQHTDLYMTRAHHFAPSLPLDERVLCREIDVVAAAVPPAGVDPAEARAVSALDRAARALAATLRVDGDAAHRRAMAALRARLTSGAAANGAAP